MTPEQVSKQTGWPVEMVEGYRAYYNGLSDIQNPYINRYLTEKHHSSHLLDRLNNWDAGYKRAEDGAEQELNLEQDKQLTLEYSNNS